MNFPAGISTLPLEVSFNETTLTLNPVLLELDSGYALIDSGVPQTAARLEEAITAAGAGIEDIRVLIFTHQDGDHAGGGAFVVERARPMVFTSATEARPISGAVAPRGPESNRYTPVAVDVECTEGTVFRTAAGPLEVINTPGHTPGHISLLLRDSGLLIAGDALVIHKGHLAGPHPQMTEDTAQAYKSIAHLADYPIQGVFCFHGGFAETSPDELRRLSRELHEKNT
jgi:glyoxylase-like metal-dependent hydrolase (beta-lactamase superfamily II)